MIVFPETPILDYFAWKLGITPVIPKFYWDAYSQEEIIKELCKELDSIAKYSEYLGTEMNVDRTTINQVAETLNQLQAGGWFEEYSDIIEAWIRDIDNIEGIVADVLNDTQIPDRVTALEGAVGDNSDDITALQTALGNEVTDRGNTDTALGDRIDDAEGLIADETAARILADDALEARDDALEARLDSLIPDIIPEAIHEAPIVLRIPSAYTSSLIEIPEGMCQFGGTWDAPLYTAMCMYHNRDTVNDAETVGSLRVYRNSDAALISEYNVDFGHAAQAAYDWVNNSIIITIWRYNNALDTRILEIPCNQDGTLSISGTLTYNVSSAGSHIAGAGRYTDDSVYTVVNESDIYAFKTAASFDSTDWETLFTFDRTAASHDAGWLQSFLYARDLDRFLVLSSHHTHIEVFNPNSGLRERTIQIDGALNFIAVEEMQAIDFRGTTLYMMNSQNYYLSDNVYQRHATLWAADLTHLQNFKESIDSVTQNVLEVELSSEYDARPIIDWAPRAHNRIVKYRMPRDLVALQYYPIQEKHIYVRSAYAGSVIPLVNIGYAYVQFDSSTFVNSNVLESIGGWFIVNTRCDWQGIGSTQWNITDAAVAQWPQTRAGNASLHAWIVARRGADIRLRSATITRTTSDTHVWADCDEATLACQTSGFDQYTYLQRTEVIVLTTRTS